MTAKSLLQLRVNAKEHGYAYWWEFYDQQDVISWREHCRTLIFSQNRHRGYLLILGIDGILKIWLNMEDKR